MNILIATEYYFGNPDLVQLSTELVRRGHQVDVLTSYASTFYRFDDPEGVDGINFSEARPNVDIPSLPYTVSFPVVQVADLIRHRQIQVCHTVMGRATNSATVALISKILRIPHVHTVQGIGTRTGHLVVDFFSETYDRSVCRLLMKWTKKVIVLSQSLIERAIRLGADPEKIVVIPSGVDCSYFNPDTPEAEKRAREIRDRIGVGDATIIGFIGRLVPVKGVKHLVSAMKQVQQEHSNAHLLIVGDGFERPELQTVAQKLKVKTTFLGWEKNVMPLYAVMDVFVLPSLMEGLSNSLLEAMAMGKPVIATDVGGNKDVVVDGENGFLVPPVNPSSLSLKLKKLIECDDLRKEMGRINRETVKRRFSLKDNVSKVETVYRSLTS